MSTIRVVRFVIGMFVAAILLSLVLPLLGIPKSHFLPPPLVYRKADGIARGYLTAKYYDITGNPFDVGGKQWFLKYRFRAKSPGPKGEPGAGPVQQYNAVMRFKDSDKSLYDSVPTTIDKQAASKYVNQQDIPTPPVPVRVRYEKTYPYINGIDAPWGGRSIAEGSNISSGWILWVVVTLVLAYLVMLLFERFSNTENL